ncbi:hypothetical protein JCM10908_005191 [Rhodotorula pacifica]|uniref:uncharacterized protein n=1 Tax=Rhodotorula pacifica TaxID=1495444 RepID=UPI003179CD29
MLSAALSNRLHPPTASSGAAANHAAVIVLSDSQFESSLLVLRQFIRQALRSSASETTTTTSSYAPGRSKVQQRRREREKEKVVLVCVEQPPERLLPTTPDDWDPRRVHIVDATLSGPYASTSTASASGMTCSTKQQVDLSLPDGLTALLSAIQSAINEKEDEDGPAPVLVVIDSVNALADEMAGTTAEALRCVKRIGEMLRGRRGSRLLLVHHDDFPSSPLASSSSATPQSIAPSLLPYLLSPSLSPSTLHLTLRPSAHLELLSREYGFSPLAEEVANDPRTRGFLDSLGRRRVGEGWKRPERAEEEDERIEVGRLGRVSEEGTGIGRQSSSNHGDGGGGGGGGCVIEWTSRGLEEDSSPSSSRSRSSIRTPPSSHPQGLNGAGGGGGGGGGEVKRLVRMGYTAAKAYRLRGQDGDEVEVEVREVEVEEVLDPRRMGVRAGGAGGESRVQETLPSTSRPTHSPAVAPSTSADSAPASSSSTTPSALPFSLSLTSQQRHARSLVSNPYAGIDKPIYGQEGYQVPIVPGAGVAGGTGGTGGGIEYVADRGDDLDEEDPDEDLEL